MEEIGDKRLYISRWGVVGGGVRVSMCVVLLQKKLWTQFYISGLLGNMGGSDQLAYLCNLIRLFFFRISSELDVHI